MVEDFIEGQTYESLLDQRLRQGQRFSEVEILQLFRKLLPVLSYLHGQGVIHRDISPDNIMLRAKDRQVVLIDMGGVKQVAIDVATQIAGVQNRAASSIATCLGKVGYAPDEQLRLGIVAPHSDLYALAVTALVLMTGKQPQELLDQHTLHWMWHRELSLSPLLTKILNRMLNRQPSGRFKSGDEILQLLQSNPSNRTYAATKPTEVNISAPVNNSAPGSIFDNSIRVPDEIKGWNWGAFLLPGLWLFPIGLGHLLWISSINKWVFLSLAMPFVLGGKGNEWTWKSRNWSSISAFKTHQRAWIKWGLIVDGSLLTLAFMVISFIALLPESRKEFVDDYNKALARESLSLPVLSPYPVPTSESSPSSPTSTNYQLMKVEIGSLETYTYAGNLFSLNVPTGWSLQDKSKSREAFVVWTDKNLNAMVSVDLFAIQRELTQDEMVNIVQTLLIHSLQSQQYFKIDPPQIQEDNSVQLTWSYTAVVSNGTKAKMLGNSFIGKLVESNKISILSFLVPADQLSELQTSINQIRDSYTINPSAPLP